MARPSTLIVATGNPGKVREIAALMPGFELIGLTEAGERLGTGLVMPDETGATYEENARLKADGICRQSGVASVADDSGLEVAALGGRPGMHSARYAECDGERIAKLLAEIQGLGPDADRSARFVCYAALARPGEPTVVAFGQCKGRIVDEPVGTSGFGFDPIFFVPDRGCTMAELPGATKNRISHRARAFGALLELF